MASKMQASTAMITMLGEDSFGKDTLANYKANGIDVGLYDDVTGQ
jgi:sugar/nucleoside kinase (ribokinase family)